MSCHQQSRSAVTQRSEVTAFAAAANEIGGFVMAILASRDESAQMEIDSLQHQWLQEHQQRMESSVFLSELRTAP